MGIAETRLGDGLRWRQIWQLNQGRQMPDARTFTDPNLVYPDWVLLLPADARPLPEIQRLVGGDHVTHVLAAGDNGPVASARHKAAASPDPSRRSPPHRTSTHISPVIDVPVDNLAVAESVVPGQRAVTGLPVTLPGVGDQRCNHPSA